MLLWEYRNAAGRWDLGLIGRSGRAIITCYRAVRKVRVSTSGRRIVAQWKDGRRLP